MKEITLATILAQLERMAVSTEPIEPAAWINGAMRVTALLGEEHTKLVHLNVAYNKVKFDLLTKYANKVSLATAEADTTQEYVDMETQGKFIERVEELCRLCKKRAELANNEYRLQ